MSQACAHCGQHHEGFLTLCPVTGAALARYTMVNEDDVLLGSVVAERYHVREILGQGGTGTVFGADHLHFARSAAMKVLRARYTSLDTVLRVFHGEARAAWAVSHPSLVEVFDIGTLPDGAPFFMMERLAGEPLAARLGRERFSIAAAVDLLMQLLSALDAIHTRDLLVRDLRPQNLYLVQRRGCRPLLKILDFGLARLLPTEKVRAEWDATRALAASDVSGAASIPFYLSPERARGGEQAVEPSSDLFVAAVIFYEALTGARPFSAPSFDAIAQLVQDASPPALDVLRPDVPAELAALVTRAMSAEPHARFASAREMQDELRSVFDGQKAQPAPQNQRGSSSIKAAPVVSAMSAAIPPGGMAATMMDPVGMAPMPTSQADSSVHTPMRTERPPADESGSGPGAEPPTAIPQQSPVFATLGPDGAPLFLPPSIEGFDDETAADGRHAELIARVRAMAEAHNAAAMHAMDEAAAEHPMRTARPPSMVEIDVEVGELLDDPTTSRGTEVATAIHELRKRGRANAGGTMGEEEETETMQLTPEIRARIDLMTRGAGAGAPLPAPPPLAPPAPPARGSNAGANADDLTRPPPTRRLGKPDA